MSQQPPDQSQQPPDRSQELPNQSQQPSGTQPQSTGTPPQLAGTPRLSGPYVIHFSPVKEVVERESGRFEFFKQMLAIGLGGIAGLAAIFTDADKVPEEALLKVSLSVFGLCAIAIVIYSGNGISAYANHLRDVKKLADEPEDRQLQSNAAGSEQSILSHARGLFVLSLAASAALILFAGIRLFQTPKVGAEAAMRLARKLVTEQPGSPSPRSLDHFQTVGNDYLITYVTEPNQVKYYVRISRDKNTIEEITPH